jgi:hypothetical protein
MTLYPNWLIIEGRRYKPEPLGTLPASMRFVRVLHERELAPELPHNVPPGRPEVRQMYPENLFVPFGRAWQMKAWEMNPLLSANNMTAVYHNNLWIANNNGFDGDEPIANYFTGEDLGAATLKVETITCGGCLLHVLGETVITRGGVPIPSYIVEALDYRDPPPLVVPPWLITHAVNMRSDGLPGRFSMGQQPNGYLPGVVHPFVSDPSKVITIPKWRCVAWVEPNAPDPYRLYL